TTRSAVAGPALGVLVLAQVQWVRLNSNVVVMAALLGLAVVLVVARDHPLVLRAGGAVIRVGASLGSAVGSLILLVVALPTLYLGGLVSRLPLRRRPAGRDGSNWQRRAAPDRAQRREAIRPFAATAPAVR